MTVSVSYIIFMLACAAFIMGISVFAYNRRLDKIARGEERGTHSAIPEPKDTAAGIYRVVLMGLVVVCLVNIGTANGMLVAMQNRINDLENRARETANEVERLREELEENKTLVADVSWEVSNPDLKSCTADVDFRILLKRFSDDTGVTLTLGGKEISLERSGAGAYSGRFTVNLFEEFRAPAVCISENGVSVTEPLCDFPEYFFWDYLPMPSMSSSFRSGNTFGKMTCEGSYRFYFDRKEDIESVTVTYMSGGKELLSADLTKEALAETEITLPKGLALEKDLTFKIDIATKSGFTISEKH